MTALTANSASGVLRGDAAAAAIRFDTAERPIKILEVEAEDKKRRIIENLEP
jgi:hypothetical protein